jgi:ribosomal protein L11 methyltransferase
MNDTDCVWTTVTVTTDQDLVDSAANFFHEEGITGVEFSDAGHGRVRVVAYVPETTASPLVESLVAYLKAVQEVEDEPCAFTVETSPLKTENWAVMWKENFRPTEVGNRLLIAPPWDVPDTADRLTVVIEPAEAFGTGTHETTRFCLMLIERAVTLCAREPCSFLDVGCGSGILAFAAARLGCSPVLALDNDPVAAESAKVNARMNGLEHAVTVECRALSVDPGQWTIVAANLDPMALEAHRDALIRSAARYLVISGVPRDQWAAVRADFESAGVSAVDELTGEEWCAGLFRAPSEGGRR